jgi:hypothetical protein
MQVYTKSWDTVCSLSSTHMQAHASTREYANSRYYVSVSSYQEILSGKRLEVVESCLSLVDEMSFYSTVYV